MIAHIIQQCETQINELAQSQAHACELTIIFINWHQGSRRPNIRPWNHNGQIEKEENSYSLQMNLWCPCTSEARITSQNNNGTNVARSLKKVKILLLHEEGRETRARNHLTCRMRSRPSTSSLTRYPHTAILPLPAAICSARRRCSSRPLFEI